MDAWGAYEAAARTRGRTKRERDLRSEKRFISTLEKDTLSWKDDVILDGVNTSFSIINSDNLNEKFIISPLDRHVKCGSMVQWADNTWIVTEKDADETLYTRAKIIQCNYLLKWISEDGVIREQWCVVEDGTKYLTGEMEDRNFIITRGDARVAITIARNEYTCKLNRRSRFLIDDPETRDKLAYTLSKPLRVGQVYNGDGVYKFVLQEVSSTSDDNQELGIADYYKYFPKPQEDIGSPGEGNVDNSGKKGWL